MKNILFACTVLLSTMLFSQNQGGIKGTIGDQGMNGEPLLFANIQLKGSAISYQTNFHGNFEISDIEAGQYTLVVSYLGYDTQALAVVVKDNQITKIETDLQPKQISFEDVAGMDVASKEKTIFPVETEELSKR